MTSGEDWGVAREAMMNVAVLKRHTNDSKRRRSIRGRKEYLELTLKLQELGSEMTQQFLTAAYKGTAKNSATQKEKRCYADTSTTFVEQVEAWKVQKQRMDIANEASKAKKRQGSAIGGKTLANHGYCQRAFSRVCRSISGPSCRFVSSFVGRFFPGFENSGGAGAAFQGQILDYFFAALNEYYFQVIARSSLDFPDISWDADAEAVLRQRLRDRLPRDHSWELSIRWKRCEVMVLVAMLNRKDWDPSYIAKTAFAVLYDWAVERAIHNVEREETEGAMESEDTEE
ncbi:Protein of unknown function [Pyronema omphalodes CBS 100304]|uniref:Uncharacterized protein n=1 Tax=Pyronema omphalodes (strain CBS 100304) TaxID=1076935 RepID=U4LMS1_PYROM|nr:Protein of unknown function [Pyronema omphalodes CBS 100304]